MRRVGAFLTRKTFKFQSDMILTMKALLLLITAALSGMLVFAVGLGALVWKVDREWSPILEPRLKERTQVSSIRVFANDELGEKKWIGSITSGRLEERNLVPLTQIPPLLVQSIVTLEDPRFLEHGGFDLFGILRATFKNLLSLRYAQGGSTITQQLVKNVFLSREKTLKRKVTELILAALLETKFNKDQILEAYLNEVYLGQMGPIEIHGVARASEYYFSKKIVDLEVQEMATLAALIKGPGVYSPWQHPDRCKARRDHVLKLIAEAKYILPEEYEAAIKKPLPGASKILAPTRAAFLMDALREELLSEKGEEALLKGGFDIEIAVDLNLQTAAEKALLESSAGKPVQFQGLVVAANPKTCEIVTYAGGTDYRLTQLDRIRQSKRPIGSLFKPLVTSHLLEEDSQSLNLASFTEDQKFEWSYDNGRQKWAPSNYDNKFRGWVSLRETLEESFNVPLVKFFYDRVPSGDFTVLFDNVRSLGLDIPPERALPSALLGAIEERPIDTLLAYVKMVRRALGMASNAADFSCRLSLAKYQPNPGDNNADGMTRYGQLGARLTIAAMEGALRRGTSRALGNKLPLTQEWAGKTGTSSDLRDSWYVALSPELVVLGWIGRDDNQVTGLTGATGALPIVSRLVDLKSKNSGDFRWPMPPFLQWKLVNISDRCLVMNEDLQKKIASIQPSPNVTTPPPEVFEHENKKYRYDLFREGAEPQPCQN